MPAMTNVSNLTPPPNIILIPDVTAIPSTLHTPWHLQQTTSDEPPALHHVPIATHSQIILDDYQTEVWLTDQLSKFTNTAIKPATKGSYTKVKQACQAGRGENEATQDALLEEPQINPSRLAASNSSHVCWRPSNQLNLVCFKGRTGQR